MARGPYLRGPSEVRATRAFSHMSRKEPRELSFRIPKLAAITHLVHTYTHLEPGTQPGIDKLRGKHEHQGEGTDDDYEDCEQVLPAH